MKHLPRTQETVNRNLRDRVRNLERGTQFNPRLVTEEIAVFSVVGDMTVSTSGIYRVRKGGQIVAVNFDATAAGSGTTTFDVLINGASPGSAVSVASGTTSSSSYIGDLRVAAGNLLQIDLTAAGMHEQAVIEVVMKG